MNATLILGGLSLLLSSATVDNGISECPFNGVLVGAAGQTQWCEADDMLGRRTKNGPWRRWHENGRLRTEGTFLDGKAHGLWYQYDARGELVGSTTYRHGQNIDSRGAARVLRRAEPPTKTSNPSEITAASDAQSNEPEMDRPTVVAENDGVTMAVTLDPEQHARRFIHSGMGPGAGKAAFGIGGRLLVIVPMLDLHLLYGFTDWFDLETRLTSVGVVSLADLGVRFRVFGDESMSLSVRAGGNVIGLFALVAEAVSIGPMPGVSFSVGDENWQLSFSQDFPIHVFQSVAVNNVGTASGNVIASMSRTTIAYETSVGQATNLYIAGQAYVPITGGSGVLPLLAVGASW